MDCVQRAQARRRSRARTAVAVLAPAALLVSAAIAQAATSPNVIKNGDFTHGQRHWSFTPVRRSGPYPGVVVATANTGGWSWMYQCGQFQGTKPFLALDVPSPSYGYVQQAVRVPHKGLLTFETWGNLEPTKVTISVVTVSNHVVHKVLTYSPPDVQGNDPNGCSGQGPVIESVNLAKFGGKKVMLRIAARANGNDGTFADFDHFVLKHA